MLLAPALHKNLWPKVKYKVRRGITADEHAKVLESELMEDYAQFFRMLWETGGSQTDIANLNARMSTGRQTGFITSARN
jgi:hypothetical protein